jgi:hypothetical protein
MHCKRSPDTCKTPDAHVATNSFKIVLLAGKTCDTLTALAAPSTCKPSNVSMCLPALAESTALLAWKAQLTDSNGTLANWTGPSACIPGKPWPGVTCSEDRMSVVAVNVSGLGLRGTLAAGLANLSNLQVTAGMLLHCLYCNI